VVPVPGPSAVLAALVASGLPTAEFTFIGFLPAKPTARTQKLQQLAGGWHVCLWLSSCRKRWFRCRDHVDHAITALLTLVAGGICA